MNCYDMGKASRNEVTAPFRCAGHCQGIKITKCIGLQRDLDREIIKGLEELVDKAHSQEPKEHINRGMDFKIISLRDWIKRRRKKFKSRFA